MFTDQEKITPMIVNKYTSKSEFYGVLSRVTLKGLNLFIILLISVGLFSCKDKIKGPENVPGEEKLQAFDELISNIAEELAIDDYSYAVLSNKDILKLVENGIAVDEQIPVGNVSNMFLSTLLLQCSEENKVNTDDLLNNYGISGDIGKQQVKNMLSFTSNPSGQVMDYSQENTSIIYHVLEAISKEQVSDLVKSNLERKLNMKKSSIQNNNGINGLSSMNDLVRFSMAIDNQQLFEKEDTHEKMFRPVYLETGERTPAGLGCMIHISDDRKIIWSHGQTDDYSTFLLKSATDSLSFIMVAKSAQLNAPFRLHTGEIENTPLYHAFVKTIFANDSANASIDFYDDYSTIRQSMKKEIEIGNRDAVYNELCAYLTMSAAMNDAGRYDSLTVLYNKFFPKDIPIEKLFKMPVAKINGTMDYVRYDRTFFLEEPKKLSVFATSEFTSIMTLSPWEYDNVEMYFDLNHERSTNFRSDKDDRQYRYNYDYQQMTGTAPTFEDITLVQYDVSPNRFNFEIAIPWKTLFNSDSIMPSINDKFGFDIAIADNDDERREGSLAWHSKLDETPWNNTSYYGSMILSKTPEPAHDTICYALSTDSHIELDGQDKGEWNGIPRYPIDNEFMSGITGPEDQSGWFRAQWDSTHLYFLVEIHDDVKRLLEKSGDYGWITDVEGDTVWMFTDDMGLHAGGDRENKYIYTQIPLESGAYKLHYQTNQTHSYGLWTKKRPELSFYGIVLYEE